MITDLINKTETTENTNKPSVKSKKYDIHTLMGDMRRWYDGNVFFHSDYKIDKKKYEMLKAYYDEKESTGKWHLCSEKQPQDPCKDYGIEDGDMYFSVSNDYLITINGEVTIGRWVRQRNCELRWQDYGEKQYEIFPTAWMPLPEPYKENE